MKKQKLDKPLTYNCSFEECDSATLERLCKIRNRTLLDIAYRGISKYADSISAAQVLQIKRAIV
jgi:hypothetical protein